MSEVENISLCDLLDGIEKEFGLPPVFQSLKSKIREIERGNIVLEAMNTERQKELLRDAEITALKKRVAELESLIDSAIHYERKIKALLMKIDANKYVSEIATLEYACQKMESALEESPNVSNLR